MSSSSTNDDIPSLADLILTPVVIKSGLVLVSLQSFWYLLFKYVLPDGPWKQEATFTAHQAACMPLMMYLVYWGMVGWFVEPRPETMEERILGLNETGHYISQVVMGMLLFWDIPLAMADPNRDITMFGHHIGMLLLSGVCLGVFSASGVPVGTYYGIYFFGVVEVSTLFLIVVDLFHPHKHKVWHDYYEQASSLGGGGGKLLQSLNETCRICFALSFLVVRGLHFPYVSWTGVWPDFWGVAMQQPEGVSPIMLKSVCISNAMFTLLQMYWAFLITRQVVKLFTKKPNIKAESKKE